MRSNKEQSIHGFMPNLAEQEVENTTIKQSITTTSNLNKEKTRRTMRIGILSTLALCTIVVLGVATQKFKKKTNEMELISIQRSISQAAAFCYAAEGTYPPSLQYLQENYGIYIDTNNYIVHYEVFASNIFPEILVFRIGEG